MNLHRVDGIPDWEMVERDQWNAWQERAAATDGWDTPGNRETLKGAIATSLGLFCIEQDEIVLGTALIGYGRLKDLKDGRVAEETGTKSPKGEMIDATTDTLLMGAALPVLSRNNILPTVEAKAIGAIYVTKSIFSAVAKTRGNEIHPSRAGKMSAFLAWCGVGSYCISKAAGERKAQRLHKTFETAGHLTTGVGIILGAAATLGYCRDALKPSDQSI